MQPPVVILSSGGFAFHGKEFCIMARAEKYVPLEKRSKKEQKAYHAQQRGSWNGVNPVTRVVPNKKVYDRKRAKARRDDPDVRPLCFLKEKCCNF